MPITITSAQFDAAFNVMMASHKYVLHTDGAERAALLAALNALGIEVLERYGDLRG